MPGTGSRKIAAAFNLRQQRRRETVGKSFVAELIRQSGEEILRLRKDLKNRIPRPLPKSPFWGMDLTFLPGLPGERPRSALGILDHGTRARVAPRELRTRTAISLIRAVLDAIEACDRPKIIRTDNEPAFVSCTFRFSLWLLGIRHQRTTPHCPWENGRIERFFLTLKQKIRPWFAESGVPEALDHDLAVFRGWYNHARPHQHLDGRTPAMAWAGKDKPGRRGRSRFFSAWNARLAGYIVPT